MKTFLSPPPDHREETRRPAHVPATLDAPNAVFPQHGPVVVEDVSACGLRLSSEMQLHPGEALVLRVPGHVLPLHADVVWRREGTPSRWSSRKTWLAGCRLSTESIVQARLALPPLLGPRSQPFRARGLVWAAGALFFLALFVFVYLKFAQLMGGSSLIPH